MEGNGSEINANSRNERKAAKQIEFHCKSLSIQQRTSKNACKSSFIFSFFPEIIVPGNVFDNFQALQFIRHLKFITLIPTRATAGPKFVYYLNGEIFILHDLLRFQQKYLQERCFSIKKIGFVYISRKSLPFHYTFRSKVILFIHACQETN